MSLPGRALLISEDAARPTRTIRAGGCHIILGFDDDLIHHEYHSLMRLQRLWENYVSGVVFAAILRGGLLLTQLPLTRVQLHSLQ